MDYGFSELLLAADEKKVPLFAVELRRERKGKFENFPT